MKHGRALPLLLLLWCPLPGDAGQTGGLDLVFALDTSDMAIEMQRRISTGARLAVQELSPADSVGLVTFASGTKLHLTPGSDPDRISDAFHRATTWRFQAGERVRVYDAVALALAQFSAQAQAGRRRAIVLLTHQIDRGSDTKVKDLMGEAKRKQVSLWAVILEQPGVPDLVRARLPDPQATRDFFEDLAAQTGGKAAIRPVSGYLLRQWIARLKED